MDPTREPTANKNPRIIRDHFSLPKLPGDVPADADPLVERVKAALFDVGDRIALDKTTTDLALISDRTTDIGRHVRLREVIQGIHVFGSNVVTQVEDEQIVRVSVGRFKGRHFDQPPAQADAAPLTEEDAMDKVHKEIGDEKELSHKISQVWYPASDGLKLAYEVQLATTEHDWRIIVDAVDGALLEKEDRRWKVVGSGKVFDPNPVVTANDNTFLEGVTSEVTLNSERVTVDLKDITKTGSKYTLKGPYVEIKDVAGNAIAPPEQTSSTFDFERNNDDFEAVNIYYHIDALQRYIQNELHITNVMNWSIPADHHSLASFAFYSPLHKHLGFGDSGPTRPDRGEDGDVMAHEYGHAIQDDIVPGWGDFNGTTERHEARAMGEGFGDALACIYYHEAGGIYQPEVFEDWVFAPDGLRRVDGVKVYPGETTTGMGGDWGSSFHSNGEIWSATLWSAYLAAGGNSSNPTEREQTRIHFLKTLLLHHSLLNTDASLPEAAEAMLETNCKLAEARGAQVMALLDSFHDRQILRSDPGVDLWIRDEPGHTGTEHWGGKFWNSPDLWVRNQDDGSTTHQNAEYGQDNWFYARVRNRGTATARAFMVTFEVKLWQGTQFKYKNDFVPFIAAAVGFNLAPGATQIVKARWPKNLVPNARSHGCLLSSVYCATDESELNKHVWEDNNLAQKNFKVVDLQPDQSTDIEFRVGNVGNIIAGQYRLEVFRPEGRENVGLAIVHPNREVMEKLYKSIRFRTHGTITTHGLPTVATRPAATVTPSTPMLTLMEPARFRIHGGIQDAGSVELNLAAGSEIFGAFGKVTGTEGEVADQGPPLMDEREFMNAQADLELDNRPGAMHSINFRPGRMVGFPTKLSPRWNPTFKLRVTAPKDARSGDKYTIDLIQRDSRGRTVGGIAVLVCIRP